MQMFNRISVCIAFLASCALSAPVLRRDLVVISSSDLPATNMNADLTTSLSAGGVPAITLCSIGKRMALAMMDREDVREYVEEMHAVIDKCDLRELVGKCDRLQLQNLYTLFESKTDYLASAYEQALDAVREAGIPIKLDELSDVYRVERSLGAFQRDVSYATQASMRKSLGNMEGLVSLLAGDYAMLVKLLPAQQGSPDLHSIDFSAPGSGSDSDSDARVHSSADVGQATATSSSLSAPTAAHATAVAASTKA